MSTSTATLAALLGLACGAARADTRVWLNPPVGPAAPPALAATGLLGMACWSACQTTRPGPDSTPALHYDLHAQRGPDVAGHAGDTRVMGVARRRLARRLLAHLNLAWLRTDIEHLQRSSWSLGVEAEYGPRWSADLYGDRRRQPWAAGGLQWAMGAQLQLSLSYARQLGDARQHQFTLGGQFAFK